MVVEIKGYAKGAKSSDISQIGLHAERYRGRHDRFPDRRWYVVNHFLHDGPSSRPTPLAGHDDLLSSFAEQGGLVLDTRDVFLAVRAVERGDVAAARVRALLMQARGVADLSALLAPEDDDSR